MDVKVRALLLGSPCSKKVSKNIVRFFARRESLGMDESRPSQDYEKSVALFTRNEQALRTARRLPGSGELNRGPHGRGRNRPPSLRRQVDTMR